MTDITFTGSVPNDIVIRIKQIGSFISNSEKITDYDELKIRIGEDEYASDNISIPPNAVAVLHNVTVTEITS